jgi:hypothetical protein
MSWIRIGNSNEHTNTEKVEEIETESGETNYIITPAAPDDSNAEPVVPETLPPAQGQE